MSKELMHVTFSISPENYEKLQKLASAKRISVPGLVWNLVMEAIEDEEDIAECLATWNDKEGPMSLEEYCCQREAKGL
jgi:hypothetical protein